jgi:hypothetical protein
LEELESVALLVEEATKERERLFELANDQLKLIKNSVKNIFFYYNYL